MAVTGSGTYIYWRQGASSWAGMSKPCWWQWWLLLPARKTGSRAVKAGRKEKNSYLWTCTSSLWAE